MIACVLAATFSRRSRALAGCLVLACAAAAVAAPAPAGPDGMGATDRWSHFLGPNADGVMPMQAFDGKGLTGVWSRELGPGCSSVTLVDGKLYTMGNQDDRDIVYCLDAATGEEVWTFAYDCERMPKLYDGGPNSTPTIADGRVYTLGRKGQVHCLDASSGAVVWTASCETWTPKGGWWGFSDSPIVWGDKVFLNISDKGMALDRATGKVVWAGEGKTAAYGTILPLPEGNPVTGKAALVVQTSSGTDIVDPATGDSLFTERPEWAGYASNNNGVAPKLYDGSLVFMHGAEGLARVSFADGKWTQDWLCPELVYDKGQWFTFNRQVIRDGHLYAIAGNAKEENTRLVCVNLDTGAVAWSRPEGFGSLILAADTLIIVTQNGDIAWGKLQGNEYAESFRQKALDGGRGSDKDGPYWSHPVLFGDRLFVRSNKGKLSCLRID